VDPHDLDDVDSRGKLRDLGRNEFEDFNWKLRSQSGRKNSRFEAATTR